MKTINIKTTIILSLAILMTVSCKKDDEPAIAPPQNVTSTFIDNNLNAVITANSPQVISIGYQFTPAVNGKITELSINLPDAGSYKISIWDVDTKTLLSQTSISQVYGNWAVKDIPDLTLEGQKTYVICFLLPANTESYIAENITMPINVTDITIQSSVASFGDIYPEAVVVMDKLYGFVDFTFQADPQ